VCHCHPQNEFAPGLFDSKVFQISFVGFLNIGFFLIEVILFKGLKPPKFLWIAFPYYNLIGFLARG
jgi:hypothetical protein